MSLRLMGQASTTMNQLQQQIDLIGHNMANSSTTGYKSKQAEFSSLLFQQLQNLSAPENEVNRLTPDGIRVGTGARLGAIHENMSLGSIQNTGRDLDIALQQPNHFFQLTVETDGVEEIHYTRDGSFYLQPINNGEDVVIVNSDGHPLIGNNGSIQFAANNITGMNITSDGMITVNRNGQTEQVGRISIVQIDQSRVLEESGNNLYTLPDLEGLNMAAVVQQVPAVDGILQNQALEMSNVDIASQMTQLINAQRSYQFNARTISMADQMQGLINQIR